MEKRAYYDRLDIVKGLAMFLVVLGHCIQCGSGAAFNEQQLFFDDGLFRFIYSFHMPLFMIISGFLYGKTSTNKPLLSMIKGRTLRLLLPVVVWQTGLTAIALVRGGGFDFLSYCKSIIEGFWFLWAAWWATIICTIVDRITKSKTIRVGIHAGIILITLFTPDELNFSLHKFMYVSFLTGLFAARSNWDEKKLSGNRKISFLIVMAAVFAGLFLLFRKESFIYISGWTLLGKENWLTILGWDIYRITIGIVGATIIIYLVYLLIPAEKEKLLKDAGKNTSGIYILQTFANTAMLKFLAGIQHRMLINIGEAIVVFIACYIIVKLISKIPYASCILFGQKTKAVKTNG